MSAQFLNQRIEKLRVKLLDLTRANPLISARLSPRSNTCIRVIDEIPDIVFGGLVDQQTFVFSALPELDESPEDERTTEFQSALATARATDAEYLAALSKIDGGGDGGDEALKIVDRALKDRVRLLIGLPKRKTRADVSLEDHARANGIDPSVDLSSNHANTKGRRDKRLQTLLLPDDLLRKLNALADKDRTWSDETGISVLKISFGILEWVDPAADEMTRSPLVLIPVKVEKTKTNRGSKFELSTVGDDPRLNTVLVEKLRRDYGITLPSFDPEEGISSYFSKIERLQPEQLRFRLRRQIIVGVFPSARDAMYADLDPGQNDFLSNPVLNKLFLGSDSSVDSPFGDDYAVDDPVIERHVPHLVLDADPSQFSALVDAAKGENLALEGPPGTGKSQTIVNIIANAIADGKKVLFVAEKMTALEVVRSRLREVGLEKFVLPFQATRAGRSALIESIRERINFRPRANDAGFNATVKYFRSTRDELSKYLGALSSPVGVTGLSVYQVLGRNIRNRDVTQRHAQLLPRMMIQNCERLSPEAQLKIHEVATRLSKIHVEIRDESPIWSPLVRPLTTIEIDEILGACQNLRDGLDLFQRVLATLEFEGGKLPSEGRLLAMVEVFKALRNITGPLDLQWLKTVVENEDPQRLIRQHELLLLGVLRGKKIERLIGRPASAVELSDLDILIDKCELHSLDFLSREALSSLCSERKSDYLDATEAVKFWGSCFELIPELSSLPIKKVVVLARIVGNSTSSVARCATGLDPAVSPDQIVMFAERGVVLQGRFRKLQEGMRGALEERVIQAKKLLSIFEWTGFIGRLFSEYRSARDQFLRDFPRSYFDKSEAESVLREFIAEFESCQSEKDEIVGHPEFSAVFGRFDRGIASPFPEILEAGRLLKQVDELFCDPYEVSSRTVVRRLSSEAFEILRRFSEALPKDPVVVDCSFADLRARMHEAEQLWVSTKADTDEMSRILRIFPSVTSARDAASLRRKILRVGAWHIKFFSGDALLPPAGFLPNKADHPDDLRKHLQLAKKIRSAHEDASWILKILRSEDKRAVGYGQLLEVLDILPIIRKSADLLRASTDVMTKVEEVRGIADRIALFRSAADDRDGLVFSSMYAESIRDLEEFGIKALYDTWAAEIAPEELSFARFVEAAICYSLARYAFEHHGGSLLSYNGERLDAVRKKIVEADLEYIKASRERVAALADHKKYVPPGVSRGPKSSLTEFGLLDHETSKTKRWISPRVLTARAGRALQGLKPCWMMSPLAVAQYLPKDLAFDICVIDEGSQMPPEDAVGALSRCKQAIVVGDTNQLPPTSFFRRVFEDDEADGDEATTEESVLELANAAFRPKRRLRWHYRSRHSSLIRFSNDQIYKDLLIFPNSEIRPPRMGVSSVFVGGLYKSGVNEIEADRISEAIFKFMKDTPDRSLGVVLLNQKQQQQVLDRYNRAFEKYDWVSSYVERWEAKTGKLEPFFIKNLENVQGDERDVIFIGTVYGPERAGAPVMQRFGPINGPAGRRRLNVLFTRAKEQIVTFTSMRASDIVAEESSNAGGFLLKKWLEYCQTGEISQGVESGREPDSEFEEHVIASIEGMGFVAVPQVGVSGFFIDIGVRHPRHPDIFLLGVECDGAAYHSSTCARDRDRIREGVLRGLGWRLHRIWSTDWFRNAPREIEKLRQVLLARLSEVEAVRGTSPGEAVPSRNPTVREAKEGEDKGVPKSEVVECEDGSSYAGQLREGKFHGRGLYRYASGDEYEGDFLNGNLHGKGIYRFSDGGSYEGEFRDDQFNGRGVYRYSSGEVYVGEFRDGEFHGKGELTLLSGETQVGVFERGEIVDWITRLPDGTSVGVDES